MRSILPHPKDLTEEDLEHELCLVRVQAALARQLLGKPDEAMQLYSGVLKSKWVTGVLSAVLCGCWAPL